jgi:superfamily II DNA or RNA helicase
MSYKLTRLGYQLPLTEENERQVKRYLIHKPIQKFKMDYGPTPKPIHNYRKSDKFLYVPRYYGITNYGPPKDDLTGLNMIKLNPEIKFEGKLRDTQIDMINATRRQFKTETKGGIWHASTGIGKTFAALFMIAEMGLKTLVVVNKEVLKRQWIREIKKVLPKASIGLIQSDTVDVENKDIIIGMLQSISKRNYNAKVFDDINFIVIDEIHNVGSAFFSQLLFKVQPKYRLGLSATPKRKDGMEKVFEEHLGPTIIHVINLTVEPKIQFISIRDLEKHIKPSLTRQGKTNMAKLITDITKSKKRNQLIIREVLKLLQQKRKLIVFSDRVQHCKLLDYVTRQTVAKYPQLSHLTSSVFIGGMKDEEYDDAKKCDVIFATFSLAKEGFDHPELDSCILSTPKSDVVQVVGRILRRKNENFPLVVDLVDRDFQSFTCMYYRRRKYYKSQDYEFLPNLELDEEMKYRDGNLDFKSCVIMEEE